MASSTPGAPDPQPHAISDDPSQAEPAARRSRGLMGRVSDLGVRTRLLGGFALVLAVTAPIGLVGWTQLDSVTETYDTVVHRDAALVQRSLEMRLALSDQVIGIRGFLITEDEKSLTPYLDGKRDFEAEFAQTGELVSTDAGRALLAEVRASYDALQPIYAQEIALVKKGEVAAAESLAEAKATPAKDLVLEELVDFGHRQETRLEAGATGAEHSAGNAERILLILIVVGLALGATIALLLARTITIPLAGLSRASEKAAEGDLTVTVGSTSRDEVGQVSQAFDAMLANFRDIVGKVTGAAAAQTTAAREMAEASRQSGQAVAQIAATVGDIARGASDQAEGTHRVTATMEEMGRGVTQVAEGGQAASSAAQEADMAAAQGAEVVSEATEAMGRIASRVDDASQVVDGLGEKGLAIGEIVGSIDRIASQTNLLALNAAIEAARAGEQGRGFAVVAEEVRKLAEESKTAAASIADIIRDIQTETRRAVAAMDSGREEVQAGVGAVARAGEAFGTIRERVERVASEVSQVAAASQELEAGALEVQGQISTVAAVSEENAAAAQQVSAATEETTATTDQVASSAQSIAAQAEQLAHLVSSFTV